MVSTLIFYHPIPSANNHTESVYTSCAYMRRSWADVTWATIKDTSCRYFLWVEVYSNQGPDMGMCRPGASREVPPPTTTTTSYSFFSPKVPPREKCRPGALPPPRLPLVGSLIPITGASWKAYIRQNLLARLLLNRYMYKSKNLCRNFSKNNIAERPTHVQFSSVFISEDNDNKLGNWEQSVSVHI